LAIDNFEIESVGRIHLNDVSRIERLGRREGNMEELLDAGNHFDDVDANEIQNIINRHIRAAITGGIPLPRDFMLRNVEDKGLKRPQPKHWQQPSSKKVLREVI
jgi:hypothetical protein